METTITSSLALRAPRPATGSPGFRVVALCLAVAACLAPLPAAGQDLGGRSITTIQVEGLSLLGEDAVLFYLGLTPGAKLDEDQLDAKIKELWARGLVDDLAVEAFPDGEGVRLLIKIKERPVLRSIEYVGLKRLSKTDIGDRIAREQIDLGEGRPLDRGQIAALKALLEEMYREKGYRFAGINISYEELSKGEVRANVTVDEGDRVRIGDIDFEGNEVFGDLRLRWVMKKTKESGPLARVLKKDLYNPANLEEDLTKVRDLYRGAGYKNVLVGEPKIEVRAEGEKRRLVLVVPVDEGERWKLGTISVEGNSKFQEKNLLSLIEARPGAWLRSDLIDKGLEKVKQAYDNSGYIFSRVEPELVERPDYVADLVVHIRENDQFTVGRIEFEGNTSTRDKVLRRELRVQEGLFINLGGVKNSVYKVNQLGYFKLNEGEPVKFDARNEEKQVDLTFVGAEDNRTELQFGAGYSETQGFFGQVSFRTLNFLGRGETLGVSVESGTQRDIFDISYFVPWFLDRPQSFGAQVFRQEIEYRPGNNFYRQESQGGVLTYGRSFGLFNSVAVSYTRASQEQEIVNDDDATQNFRQDIENSSLRPGWTYNSIDNRFEPTRGQRIRASVDVSGGFLGGNNYLYRPEMGYTFFHPSTRYPVRTVWGFNIEAGMVEPFGTFVDSTGLRRDRPLNPFERYRMGGENSIRGHRYNSIFVRDDQDIIVIDPEFGFFELGGDKYLQVNVEYHFLLGGPFRMILFADGGNVWSDFRDSTGRLIKQSPDLGNLRWTAGAELRLLVPVFGAPLRFIYARNLTELPGDDFDSFRFSVGASF